MSVSHPRSFNRIKEDGMKNAIPRRTFLRTAGAAAAAGSGLFGADKGRAEATLPLSGAPTAVGGSRLFVGCCAYSFRKYLEHGPMTMEDFILKGVEVMKPACDYAGKKGITLGVEDHGGITQKAETTLEVLRRVDSPYAGVNLDISNFLAASDDEQYAQIEACIPYATHTHIRDRFGDTHRPIDLDRVWQLFRKGGYKGYMSAEYEGEEDAMTGVPKLIDRIKSLCKKYSTA